MKRMATTTTTKQPSKLSEADRAALADVHRIWAQEELQQTLLALFRRRS